MPTATAPAEGLTAVALAQWPQLAGLAALLTGSSAAAQDGYLTALRRRAELRNGDAALAYLRRVVVERSRKARGSNAPLDLDVLPRRQREALVLREYAGATDAQTAAALRVGESAVAPLVAKALESLDLPPEVLRSRLRTYANALHADRPDIALVAGVARRQRRRSTALLATASVVVLALFVTGGIVLVHPRGHGPVLEGPLPGIRPGRSIRVPAALRIDSMAAADGRVWAIADSGGDNVQSQVLHGTVDGALVPVAGAQPSSAGSAPDVAVSGDRAVLLDGVPGARVSEDSNGDVQMMISTYDAATATRLSSAVLPPDESAEFVQVLGGRSDVQALVMSRPASGGSLSLTVSLFEDGQFTAPRGPVTVPATALPYGGSAGEVTAVSVSDGMPTIAYLQGTPGSLARIDLTSGAVTPIRLTGNTSDAGSSSGVEGEVGGRLLYQSSDGLFAGAPGSSRTQRVGDGSNQEQVLVAGGRAYIEVAPTEDTWQELDPTTFAPVGPIVTVRAGQGPVLALSSGGTEVTLGADVQGFGGTATYYER